jgi:Asp-tRNA(Asn)/Glu-tRNA(Gln) amidotransferase A subunit family amidase
MTYKELIKKVHKNLTGRAKRIRILHNSNILPAHKDIDVDKAVEQAIEALRAKPERIIDWFTCEEIALHIKMEEV